MHNEPNTTKEKKANNWPWLWFPSFYACQPSRPLQFREWELWSGPGFHLTGKGFLGVYDWFRSLRLYDPCGENMNKVFGPFDEAACRRPPWQWKLLTANWRFSLPALCVSYSYSYGLCSDMSLIFGGGSVYHLAFYLRCALRTRIARLVLVLYYLFSSYLVDFFFGGVSYPKKGLKVNGLKTTSARRPLGKVLPYCCTFVHGLLPLPLCSWPQQRKQMQMCAPPTYYPESYQ